MQENSLKCHSEAFFAEESLVSSQYLMVIAGVQRLYALQKCAIHKGIALLTLTF